MGIIYVLIGALCFAISNAYWKKVTAIIPYQIGMFYRGIFATIIFSILYFGFRQADFFKYWVVRDIAMDKEFILSIALSVFNIFGLVFFLQGIQKAPVSVVVPVSSLKIFTIITMPCYPLCLWFWFGRQTLGHTFQGSFLENTNLPLAFLQVKLGKGSLVEQF
jgi:hypothetical protein